MVGEGWGWGDGKLSDVKSVSPSPILLEHTHSVYTQTVGFWKVKKNETLCNTNMSINCVSS